MTVKEIVAMELSNTESIYLLREGLFYRAYNQSAMRMVLYLKAYKVNHKFVKTVQQEIFYIGFPSASLSSIKSLAIDKGFQVVEPADSNELVGSSIVINGILGMEEDYPAWIACQLKPAVLVPESSLDDDSVHCPETVSLAQEREYNVIKQIEDFCIENATPMEALLFINQLKQRIRHGNV